MHFFTRTLLLATAVAITPAAALAQSGSGKTIRIVVPYTARRLVGHHRPRHQPSRSPTR